MSVNKLKAALFAFTPKDEIYLARSERFKRRLFHDNLQRVKQFAAPGEELYRAVRSSIHWDCRWWVARAYLLFLLVTHFFQLWIKWIRGQFSYKTSESFSASSLGYAEI